MGYSNRAIAACRTTTVSVELAKGIEINYRAYKPVRIILHQLRLPLQVQIATGCVHSCIACMPNSIQQLF